MNAQYFIKYVNDIINKVFPKYQPNTEQDDFFHHIQIYEQSLAYNTNTYIPYSNEYQDFDSESYYSLDFSDDEDSFV